MYVFLSLLCRFANQKSMIMNHFYILLYWARGLSFVFVEWHFFLFNAVRIFCLARFFLFLSHLFFITVKYWQNNLDQMPGCQRVNVIFIHWSKSLNNISHSMCPLAASYKRLKKSDWKLCLSALMHLFFTFVYPP